ncbi:hypothetical protein COK35_25780 [Bacillus cereus]|nr:hypothetical protein CN291_30895 [Bacillus cereus]PFR46273.1 hypothetical protein COK35_25780 [Bacillus cereus]PGW22667.1 hypothetical protein COD88_26985 [Bacillus cereus]
MLFQEILAFFLCFGNCVITVFGDSSCPIAIEWLKKEKSIPSGMRLRQQKYLNKIVEQDQHLMLWLKYFDTSISILFGVEAIHMVKKNR